ncbi:hypothetical protein HPB52_005335 [Rhipicephalus sanguineus]|uniref:Peptidase M13 N-terminal domain-containing protein n=1 Tax=Rhipicephalus sanguineus TaxID=34632 RepID=A0A9D4SVR5_RHISA|nr:hypothetical protein HPB52_005335 [Rhipicephalus sanguineus]
MDDEAASPPAPTESPAKEGGKKSLRKKSRLSDRCPTPGARSPEGSASPDRTRRTSSGSRRASTARRRTREYRRPTPGNRSPSSGNVPDKARRSSSGARGTSTEKELRAVRDKMTPQRLTDRTSSPVPSRSPAGGTTRTRGQKLRSRSSSSSAAAIGGEAATTQDGPNVIKEQEACAEERLPASGNESESTPCDGTPGPRVQDTTSATLTQMEPSESKGLAEKPDTATRDKEDAREGTAEHARSDRPSKDKSGLEPKLTPLQFDKPRSLSFAQAKPKEKSPGTKTSSVLDRASSHQREPNNSPLRSRPEWPFRPPRFHWTWLVLAALVLAVVALFFLSPLWRRHESVGRRLGACVTDECYHVAKFLGKSLNFTVNPCINFNSFVCSKWKPQSEFISSFEVEMSRSHMRRMADFLLTGKPHFNESAKSARFMRKCTDQTENPEDLKRLTAFAEHVGIPWPYQENAPDSVHARHPLDVVFELSVRWGIYTWFDVVLRAFESEARSERAFYIETGDNPTGSLNFVRTLKINNARERYYEDFCRLYKVQCKSGAELERLFEIEESVLSILDDAVDRGRNNIARLRPKNLEALIRNVTAAEWTHLVTVYVPEYENPVRFPFYFGNKMLLVALDKMFYMYKREDIMAHLAWWFVQMHTVIGSPSGHLIFAGNLESAAKLMAVDCYDMASEKLGLLLAAESAVSLFTAAERHHAKSLLRRLNELVIEMVNLLPWSEKGRRYVASKIAGLHVVTFPENLENLDAYLSDKYSDFLDTNGSLIKYWFTAAEMLYALKDSDYEFMQYRWRAYHLELIDYDYWTNQASDLK